MEFKGSMTLASAFTAPLAASCPNRGSHMKDVKHKRADGSGEATNPSEAFRGDVGIKTPLIIPTWRYTKYLHSARFSMLHDR
jgi:hypothetical protein